MESVAMKGTPGGSVDTSMALPRNSHLRASRRSLSLTSLLLAVILAMLVGTCRVTSSHAATPTTRPDWLAQFLTQAPAEYARLERTAGRWEIRYVVTSTSFAPDGSRKVDRRIVNRCRTVFDDRLGGIRSDVDAISPTTQPDVAAGATNPEYSFEVERQPDGRYALDQFSGTPAAQSAAERWVNELENHRGLEAEDFDGVLLLRAVRSGEVKVTAANTIDLDGKTCVRFECQREFKSSRHPGTYPGWVVLDPSFHWAVRACEHQFPNGSGFRRVTKEYNPAVTDVAFPRRTVQEDFGRNGRLQAQEVIEFDDPRPSHATAKDFMLESFGLATPHAIPVTQERHVGLTIPIIGTVLLALVVLFAFFRRGRRRNVEPRSS
jgi:hypothetical protein